MKMLRSVSGILNILKHVLVSMYWAARSCAVRVKKGLQWAFLFSATTVLFTSTLTVSLAGFSPVLAYATSDIATSAETYSDGSNGGQCKAFVNAAVQVATGSSTGGYQQGFAAGGAIEITNPANAIRGDIIQITPAGSIDSTAENLHGTDSAHRLHTAIIRAPRNSDGTFNVIDSNFNNDLAVLRHTLNPYTWASGSIIKIWRFAGSGTVPGGWWLGPSPSDGTTLSPSPAPASVSVNVHGAAGSAALDHIDITWEAEGTNQWSKQTQWLNTNASVASSDFAYNIPKPSNGWPTSLIISFDVYGTDGRVHYAPQGMRRICIANVSCASTSVAPVNSGATGQNGGGGGSQTTGCSPSATQVAFFESDNYQGTCVVKEIGRYDDPTSLGIANDSVSSIKVGNLVKVRACNNAGNNSPCEEFTGDDAKLSDNSIGDNTISSAEVTSRGGVQLCTDPNYGGTCVAFGLGSVNDLAQFGLSSNVSSIKVSSANTLFMFSDLNQTGTPSAWNSDVPDLAPHSWDNFARSIRIEPVNDTTCSIDPNANGIYLYRDGNFATGGGCKFVSSDVPDLRPSTFNGFTGIKFVGNYQYHYLVSVYKDANYGNFCGSYWLDQPWMANPDCTLAQGGVTSLKITPYTPPTQAQNIAAQALRDHTGSDAVVDNDLGTEWIGGHQVPLGFVFQNPVVIKSVVVFDRSQSSTDNNQDNKSKLVFSDGTVIQNIDMGSGGPRCAEVDFPARAYSWVNVIPDDASGNNGLREVQIWDTSGDVFSNNNCINKYTMTPVSGVGPAPLVSWPTVTIPTAVITSPANNTVFPAGTTTVGLDFNTGDSFRVHVWGNNYDNLGDWSTATHADIANLASGTYAWQVQSRNAAGEGPWSSITTFSINTVPVVEGGQLAMTAGTTQTIQVQASDADSNPLALSATGLPAFASFTDNHDGTATLTLNPSSSQTGTFTVTVIANDGQTTGSGQIQVTVAAPTPPTGTITAGVYELVNPNSGKVLDVNGGGTSDGTNVQIWTDGGDQLWQVSQNTDGTYKLTDVNSGKVLDVNGGNTADGTNVQIWTDNGSGAQKWAFTQNTDGTYKLLNTNSNKALDVNGGGTSDGTNVQIWTDNASGAQKWQLAAASAPPSPPPAGSYQAQYYNNQTLSGTPVLTRSESTINNDWGGGSPDPSVAVDHFSARWTKTDHFDAGTYRFTATGDDGLRLYIDGALIIDQWIDQGATTYTADKTLAAGDHTIVYEYYENGGGAVAKLSYALAPTPPPVDPNAYQAQYFSNMSLSGTPVFTATEATIDHDWGDGSPDASVPTDGFSARWTKTVNFDAGTYRFTATGDDGLRLKIDGQTVIDKWIDQPTTIYTLDKTLTAGAHTIVYEYYENQYSAIAKLSYQLAPTQTNLAASGTAYRWWKNTSSTSNSNKVATPSLNDGNTLDDVSLVTAGQTDNANAYEAAGVTWGTAKTVSSVEFINGSWADSGDGAFTANFKLQFTTDGTTWTNASWTPSPSYIYDSSDSAGRTYVFSGTPVNVKGVRVTGQVRTPNASSWYASAREVRAY